MNRPTPRLAVAPCAIALAAVCGALAGCGATEGGAGRQVVRVQAPEWIARPAAGWDGTAEPCAVFASARALLERNAAQAEADAMAAALASLGDFARTAVARLDAVFAARAGAVLDAPALAALASDPTLRGQLAEGARAAARLQGKWSDDDAFSIWLKLDADQGLFVAYEQSLVQKLASQARELTAADRTALRAELVQVVAERNGAR